MPRCWPRPMTPKLRGIATPARFSAAIIFGLYTNGILAIFGSIRMQPRFLIEEFGTENVHSFIYSETNKRIDFPVRLSNGSTVSSLDESSVLSNIPVMMAEFVFVSGEKRQEAENCIKNEIDNIIKPYKEDEQ